MKVIIVEDEAIAARKLKRMLEKHDDISIVHTISSVSQLKDRLSETDQPDLYFFDIHLNDGIVFEALEGGDFDIPIIFTTAYDQYAIKAFKQNSIDYLLKPVDSEELKNALEKFKKSQKPNVDLASLASLLSNTNKNTVTQTSTYKKRISVQIGDKIKSYGIEDILFFYSENKMNYMYTQEGRSYPINQTIESICKELDPSDFFRVNRGYIISVHAISLVIAYSNSRLKIKIDKAADHEIIVSREKVKDFKAWLG
jgi:DNA-binding LytR/AlgR family response regulator